MKNSELYAQKDDAYFAFVRRDIDALLPNFSASVLEIGCGGGATLAWLKAGGRAGHTTGLELCAAPAAQARTRVDRVLEGDLGVTLGELEAHSFDLVLCLDVLEHLADPWATVRQLHALLKPGGSIIVSLPNVGHHSVVLPLLQGRWEYREAGIMDRTHLRFFTRNGAQDLLQQGGFVLSGGIDAGLAVTRRRELWKALIAKTRWRDLAVFQFLLRADKPARGADAVRVDASPERKAA